MSSVIPNDYDGLIYDATREFLPDGYDWRLLKAQYMVESSLNPDAVSPAGAQGIAQFMTETWSQWANPGSDPHRARPSIDAGARYMNWLLDNWYWKRPWMDRVLLALVSYNAGLGVILEAQKAAGEPRLFAPIMAAIHEVTSATRAEHALQYVPRTMHYWTITLMPEEAHEFVAG